MPKMATKAADNVFYKARIAAASWNDRLGSREGASEVTGIDRTRLANIELGTINPHPEEVLMLSDTYNAPELQNHFCSHLCPLGIGTISPIELEELERVTLQLISAMKSLPEVKDGIIDIAADGVIDAKEKPRMQTHGSMWRTCYMSEREQRAITSTTWPICPTPPNTQEARYRPIMCSSTSRCPGRTAMSRSLAKTRAILSSA